MFGLRAFIASRCRAMSSLIARRILQSSIISKLPAYPRIGFVTPATYQSTSLSDKALLVSGSRGYKTKSSLKLRCEHCFFARRRGKLRVICKENPKHKQVQI